MLDLIHFLPQPTKSISLANSIPAFFSQVTVEISRLSSETLTCTFFAGSGLAHLLSKLFFTLTLPEAYSKSFAEMAFLDMKVAVGKKPIGTLLSYGQKYMYDSVLES